MKLTRREALGLLGAIPFSGRANLSGEPFRSAESLALQRTSSSFERGAVIRTLLKDVAPDAVNGAVLFHEHLSIRYPLTKALAEKAGRPVPTSFTDDVDLMVEETR